MLRLKPVLIAVFALIGVSAAPFSAWADLCPEVFTGKPSSTIARQPRLIILSAPSGGGKTTLANMLIKDFPDIILSVSSTTRAPRGQERNGVDYHFLSVEEFKSKIAQGGFAEWAQVHGNYYGTEIRTIKNAFAKGQSVLALVDVHGADKLRRSFPGEIFTIFISPPDLATLEKRLRARGTDSDETIQLRLSNAKKEMDEARRFDKMIINDDLRRAYLELKELIQGQQSAY
ncbi:MAG: guanylate kinase [Bdellovibrionota bacterium]